MIIDDLVGDAHPQAGTFAGTLGGKERIEDPFSNFIGYSRAGVGKFKDFVLSFSPGDYPQFLPWAFLHGQLRVVDDIKKDLGDLITIRHGAGQVRIEIYYKFDSGGV